MQKFKIVPSEEGGSLEEAMLEFNSLYIPKDSIVERYSDIPETEKAKLFGRVAGSIDAKVKKYASSLELEIEGKKTNEIVELLATTYEGKITELNEKIDSLTANAEKETKAEIDTLKTELAAKQTLIDKLKTDLDTTIEAKTNIEQSFTEKERQLIISNKLESAKSQYILVDDSNTRDACQLDILKLKFELDSEGKEIVKNEKGDIILSTSNTGYADYKEVLGSIYTKRNAHKKVIGGGVSGTPQKVEITPVGG